MLRSIRSTFIMIGECFRMSLNNILGNRARSFLTVLGILIGVAAVIALITTVNGFSGSLSSSFSSMGAGTLTVTVSGNDPRTFSVGNIVFHCGFECPALALVHLMNKNSNLGQHSDLIKKVIKISTAAVVNNDYIFKSRINKSVYR